MTIGKREKRKSGCTSRFAEETEFFLTWLVFDGRFFVLIRKGYSEKLKWLVWLFYILGLFLSLSLDLHLKLTDFSSEW